MGPLQQQVAIDDLLARVAALEVEIKKLKKPAPKKKADKDQNG